MQRYEKIMDKNACYIFLTSTHMRQNLTDVVVYNKINYLCEVITKSNQNDKLKALRYWH